MAIYCLYLKHLTELWLDVDNKIVRVFRFSGNCKCTRSLNTSDCFEGRTVSKCVPSKYALTEKQLNNIWYILGRDIGSTGYFDLPYSEFTRLLELAVLYSEKAPSSYRYIRYKKFFSLLQEKSGLCFYDYFEKLLRGVDGVLNDLFLWSEFGHCSLDIIPFNADIYDKLAMMYGEYLEEIRRKKEAFQSDIFSIVTSIERLNRKNVIVRDKDFITAIISFNLYTFKFNREELKMRLGNLRKEFASYAIGMVYDYIMSSRTIDEVQKSWLIVDKIVYQPNFSSLKVIVSMRKDILELKDSWEDELNIDQV